MPADYDYSLLVPESYTARPSWNQGRTYTGMRMVLRKFKGTPDDFLAWRSTLPGGTTNMGSPDKVDPHIYTWQDTRDYYQQKQRKGTSDMDRSEQGTKAAQRKGAQVGGALITLLHNPSDFEAATTMGRLFANIAGYSDLEEGMSYVLGFIQGVQGRKTDNGPTRQLQAPEDEE